MVSKSSSFLLSKVSLVLSTLFISTGKACFVELNDSPGELSSYLYLNTTMCTWRLTAPVGQVVEITFTEVEFDESTEENGDCIDKIKVFSGESSEILPPFCGVGPPWPRFPIRVLSKSNIMTVTMEKNLGGSVGFRASYMHVPPRQEFVAFIVVDEPSIIHHNRLAARLPLQKIPLIGSRDPSALSFNPVTEFFYLSDIHDKFIGRLSLHGGLVEKVVQDHIDTPLGVAVAYLTGLLYWTDAGRQEVSVSRLDGSFRKSLLTLSSGCRTPKGIALTPNNKNIFWTCEGLIQKSNADGSNLNPEIVVESALNTTAITVDPTEVYLYWLDPHLGVLERIRVDGFGRAQVVSLSSGYFDHIHSLAMDEFAFFFTNLDDQKLHYLDRNLERLRSRTYNLIPRQTFRGLYYHKSDIVISEQHACAISNGGCDELCFPNEDSDSVTCRDVTPLIFNCPDDIIMTSDSPFEVVDWIEPTAISRSSDQSSNVPPQFRSHSPMSAFLRGTTEVLYVFEDNVSNKAECAFNVTIHSSLPPLIFNCPDNIIMTSDSPSEVVDWIEPTAISRSSDQSSNVPPQFRSHSPMSAFMRGTTEVLYVFEDNVGNKAECAFNVTIHSSLPPLIFNCPDNIVMTSDSPFEAVDWIEPTAISRSSDQSSNVPPQFRSHSPMSTFMRGTTEVLYVFEDNVGNEAECTFNVTIQSSLPPLIFNCPDNIIMTSDSPSEVVDWIEPTAISRSSDQSSNVPPQFRSHSPMSTFMRGTTEVLYVFEDNVGNKAECAFNVTIRSNSSTTFIPTSSHVTESSPTTISSNDTSNDPFFLTPEFIIIVAAILLLCLAVGVLTVVLCCCWCCKCDCCLAKQNPRTENSIPMTKDVNPYTVDPYAIDNSPYQTNIPRGVVEDCYITVVS